jgi:glycosyltransferase involved in cell wall biosynthesis
VRILYLNTNPRNRLEDAAGYATHMAKTIGGFEAAGHEVVRMLAGSAEGAAKAREAYRGVRRRLPTGAARLVRDLYEVLHDGRFSRANAGVVRREGIDFIYERANAFHAAGLRMARGGGVPLVLEINDPLRESVSMQFSLLKPLAVRREDMLLRRADLVVLGSRALRDHYAARGFDAGRMIVLYPTADEQLFDPAADGAAVRASWRLDGQAVAGFVGSMAPWHRLDLFLEAMARLPGGGVRGLVVGERPGEARPADGGPASVISTGKVPYAQVPRYVAAMDICVIANATWYGSPTKLFEYGVMGKAVVAPRCGPIQEVIEDGVSGLLFTPGSHEELGERIRRLAGDPALRARLGQALRRTITGRFSWESNTREVIQRVRALGGARGGAR